jgi:hypothetical protein
VIRRGEQVSRYLPLSAKFCAQFGEGAGDANGFDLRAKLPADLGYREHAAQNLAVILCLLNYQRMLAAMRFEGGDDIANMGGLQILHAEDFQPLSRRHDVFHHHIGVTDALGLHDLHRFFAGQIGRSDQAQNVILVIHHQQHPDAAMNHLGPRGFDRFQREDRVRSDDGEIGHHRRGRLVQGDLFGQRLARFMESCALL